MILANCNQQDSILGEVKRIGNILKMLKTRSGKGFIHQTLKNLRKSKPFPWIQLNCVRATVLL